MRRTNKQFVLFLLVVFFVLLPLLLCFFSFTFNHLAHQRHVNSTLYSIVSLPTCLNVDSAEFLRPHALHKLKTQCGMKNTSKLSKKRHKIRLVHFVHVELNAVPGWNEEQQQESREEFTYLQFTAVQSIRRILEPDIMMMHYLEIPRGIWYTQCQRHLGLHQVMPPVSFNAKSSTLSRQKRRQIMEILIMLRVLKKHGGVALSDFNTFLLRKGGVDMEEEMVVASQTRSSSGTFRIGLHMMQSPPGHPFVEYLERKIVELVENNDIRLHQMELDQAVGQIVLEKYLEEQQAEINAKTIAGNRVIDGIIIVTSNLYELDGLHHLLTAKVGPSLGGKFRDVAGFHVDKYDSDRNTADTDDIREIARMQKDLTLADEWKSLDTLLGAVMRLMMTANTSAELEPVFK
ncbi:unnamed protein product [Peronospora belbahrii]|uniref:Uncharacterized protein n=1 Tax=Peronospora belbahrii TaxID=622444 RepID=A0ABN8CX49_9STRA|nr:unnamed protein product [Peronospora belbahrii]